MPPYLPSFIVKEGTGQTHSCYLKALKGSVVEATEQLIEAHNPTWSMGGSHEEFRTQERSLGSQKHHSCSYS